MTKKLLNKTTQSFLTVAVVILLLAAPLFYWMSQWLYLYEANELLQFHKAAFVEKDLPRLKKADIDIWNRFERNVQLLPYRGLKGDSVFTKRYYDPIAKEYQPYRELWTTIDIEGSKYSYVEKQNMVEMEDMAYSVVALFLIIIIVLLVGVLVFSNRLAKKIWSPFYRTLSLIHDFEIDKNKKPDFTPSGIAEFDSLNNSLDKLIEKNVRIYHTQREFVENAAHELQTPLALFQAKVGELAQSEGLSEKQSDIISALNTDITRLRRLNKNLLLLSKIDNGAHTERHQVNVVTQVNKNFDFFLQQAAAREIAVILKVEHDLFISADPVTLDVLINNLFLNAIRHNVANGSIEILIKDGGVIFTNTGEDAALDGDKLFNRFSKADPSSKGNGLGLAIVKKIVDVNGWSVTYSFSEKRHNFKISF